MPSSILSWPIQFWSFFIWVINSSLTAPCSTQVTCAAETSVRHPHHVGGGGHLIPVAWCIVTLGLDWWRWGVGVKEIPAAVFRIHERLADAVEESVAALFSASPPGRVHTDDPADVAQMEIYVLGQMLWTCACMSRCLSKTTPRIKETGPIEGMLRICQNHSAPPFFAVKVCLICSRSKLCASFFSLSLSLSLSLSKLWEETVHTVASYMILRYCTRRKRMLLRGKCSAFSPSGNQDHSVLQQYQDRGSRITVTFNATLIETLSLAEYTLNSVLMRKILSRY